MGREWQTGHTTKDAKNARCKIQVQHEKRVSARHMSRTGIAILSCTTVFRTDLGIGEVGDRIEVGGNELAPRVLVDAQLSVLDLVVVDHPVKAHNHR